MPSTFASAQVRSPGIGVRPWLDAKPRIGHVEIADGQDQDASVWAVHRPAGWCSMIRDTQPPDAAEPRPAICIVMHKFR